MTTGGRGDGKGGGFYPEPKQQMVLVSAKTKHTYFIQNLGYPPLSLSAEQLVDCLYIYYGAGRGVRTILDATFGEVQFHEAG